MSAKAAKSDVRRRRGGGAHQAQHHAQPHQVPLAVGQVTQQVSQPVPAGPVTALAAGLVPQQPQPQVLGAHGLSTPAMQTHQALATSDAFGTSDTYGKSSSNPGASEEEEEPSYEMMEYKKQIAKEMIGSLDDESLWKLARKLQGKGYPNALPIEQPLPPTMPLAIPVHTAAGPPISAAPVPKKKISALFIGGAPGDFQLEGEPDEELVDWQYEEVTPGEMTRGPVGSSPIVQSNVAVGASAHIVEAPGQEQKDHEAQK